MTYLFYSEWKLRILMNKILDEYRKNNEKLNENQQENG